MKQGLKRVAAWLYFRFFSRRRAAVAAMLTLVFALASVPAAKAAPGELPLPSLAPAKTRSALLRSAAGLFGTPYRFGGEDRSGLDCSGFIALVFAEATGRSTPRTVALLSAWVLPIPKNKLVPGDLVFFDTSAPRGSAQAKASSALAAASMASSGRADHVGIYEGDGFFLHAASAGSKTGVTRNSLQEPSWARRFLFAGRAVSASALSGLALEWSVSASFDNGLLDPRGLRWPEFRGAGLRLSASYPLGNNFSIGLQSRAEWDRLLGTFRIPLELLIGQNVGFSVFAGPALSLGSPLLSASETGSTDRGYTAVSEWIASAGIRWAPFLLRSGAFGAGLFAELRFDRYLPLPGQSVDSLADFKAAVSFGLGLRFRAVQY